MKTETYQGVKDTIMTATDAERKAAEEFVQKTYLENKVLYAKASSIVTKLGLSGLWKGYFCALAEVILALKEAEEAAQSRQSVEVEDDDPTLGA